MKKIFALMPTLIALVCLFSSCHSQNYTEVVIFHNERYERYDGDFIPTGKLSTSIQRCFRGYYDDGKNYNPSDYNDNTNVQTYDRVQ